MPMVQPTLRFRHTPTSEPPYDDETGRALEPDPRRSAPGVQGALALSFPLPCEPPGPRPHLRLVRDADPGAPPPRAWAGQFTRALVEVMAGARPVSQLARWMTERTYEVVYQQVKGSRRQPPFAPGPTSPRERPPTGRSAVRRLPEGPSVRSVHVSTPDPGVTEACALVVYKGRGRALALRFEASEGRWLCTAVELG